MLYSEAGTCQRAHLSLRGCWLGGPQLLSVYLQLSHNAPLQSSRSAPTHMPRCFDMRQWCSPARDNPLLLQGRAPGLIAGHLIAGLLAAPQRLSVHSCRSFSDQHMPQCSFLLPYMLSHNATSQLAGGPTAAALPQNDSTSRTVTSGRLHSRARGCCGAVTSAARGRGAPQTCAGPRPWPACSPAPARRTEACEPRQEGHTKLERVYFFASPGKAPSLNMS